LGSIYRQRFIDVYKILLGIYLLVVLQGCSENPLNSPYEEVIDLNESVKTIYSSFSERPKHLDPARAYSSNEYAILSQIYEPLYQYHYLKRPYQLEPLTATSLPIVKYFDIEGNLLADDIGVSNIAYSEYQISLQTGIQYQPHAAFSALQDKSRQLRVDDYIYQIKRLADPSTQSPIAGLMKAHIVGFSEFIQQQQQLIKDKPALSKVQRLQSIDMAGLKKINNEQFIIRIKGKYPQFINWLAMPFFAPMPWEADQYYDNPELQAKNISLDWYPVGTGPFYLQENNPNRRMVLVKNPNFHDEKYPSEGTQEDKAKGLLDDAGKHLPLSDKVIFSLEKESIPYWNKFLQGYYDASGISSDSFDQAVSFNSQGGAQLTSTLQERGIKLQTAVTTSSYYFGFNMLDKTVGSSALAAKKLRQAISIAIDYEEYISIFQNGRGVPAHGIIPPGIFGFIEGEKGINRTVYNWNQQVFRKPLEEAEKLMAEAGYPNGIDSKTAEPLVLYFDTMDSGPDSKARLNWLRKQFNKLNIQLVIRATDYNRFQEKMRNGSAQMFMWGWNADYPDPENFLFLLYGENAKAIHGGENAANYQNAEYDRLFERMSTMENSIERQAIIDEMMLIIRDESPWLWGFHPKAFSLHHAWYKNVNTNLMANNKTKYINVDPTRRALYQQQWNKPVFWPLAILLLLTVLLFIPAYFIYRKINNKTAL